MTGWRVEIASYLVSLPERVLRSASALAGGVLHEAGTAALPAAVRRTRLYGALVGTVLRFLVEKVGEVEGVFPDQAKLADDFLLRRTAGNGLELIGLLTFRASPVWVLAALADLSGAGRHLLGEIAAALRAAGVIAPQSAPQTMEDLLTALEKAAGQTADTINTPPLNTAELRRDWNAVRTAWSQVPAPSIQTLEGVWRDLVDTAIGQGRGVFELSAAIALGAWVAARTAGSAVTSPVLEHYTQTLADIRSSGFLPWWRRQFSPYLRAAASQFSTEKRLWSGRWVRRRLS